MFTQKHLERRNPFFNIFVVFPPFIRGEHMECHEENEKMTTTFIVGQHTLNGIVLPGPPEWHDRLMLLEPVTATLRDKSITLHAQSITTRYRSTPTPPTHLNLTTFHTPEMIGLSLGYGESWVWSRDTVPVQCLHSERVYRICGNWPGSNFTAAELSRGQGELYSVRASQLVKEKQA